MISIFIILLLTNEANGMNRKLSDTLANINKPFTSLSPHQNAMSRIFRSRAGKSVTFFTNIAPVSMENGKFLKGDLHVHVPVTGQDIPNYDVSVPKKDGGVFPDMIYPYSSDTREPLVETDRRTGAIRVDHVYDQATTSWEYILQDLRSQKYDFVTFVTHDLKPERIDRTKFEDFCQDNNMICFTGTETRWERHVNCKDRNLYSYVCASDGNHVLHLKDQWDRFNVIYHPTISESSRLDPDYYERRRNHRTITGLEAGTPYMIEQEAIEIFSNWYYESMQLKPSEKNIEHVDSGFVSRDTGAFSFNKWDAALSRGNILWATAGSCAYSKSHLSVQLHRLTSGTERKETDMNVRAMRIRSTKLGKGHLRVFIPNAETSGVDKERILSQMERGQFYSVVLLSKRPEIHVESIVFEKPNFSVRFSSKLDADTVLSVQNLKCSAITNHGRIVADEITPRTREDTVEIVVNPHELCRSHAFSVNYPCTYVRVHCKYYEDHYVFNPVFDIDGMKTLQQRFCHKCDDMTEEKKSRTSVVHNGLVIKQSSKVCCKPSNPMHREKLRAIKYEDRMKVKSLFEPFEKTNAEFYDSMLKALGMSSSQQDAAETRAVDPGDGSHKASLERVFTEEYDRCVGEDAMYA